MASLRVLQKMTSALEHFRRAVVQKSGLSTLVRLLSEPNQEVRCLAAGTLAHAVRTRKSRTLTRKAGAVPLLVGRVHPQSAIRTTGIRKRTGNEKPLLPYRAT